MSTWLKIPKLFAILLLITSPRCITLPLEPYLRTIKFADELQHGTLPRLISYPLSSRLVACNNDGDQAAAFFVWSTSRVTTPSRPIDSPREPKSCREDKQPLPAMSAHADHTRGVSGRKRARLRTLAATVRSPETHLPARAPRDLEISRHAIAFLRIPHSVSTCHCSLTCVNSLLREFFVALQADLWTLGTLSPYKQTD
ncbi:hypothetical protein HBI70_127740 [Parastagonospora nodorum]|nr:hypothetical protein HBI70_127740 [Parastagonospora nodorum]KAH5749852.1 hypothetical protein HBI17_102500 [Parastagonospora nodorum]KAH6438128.1 hypothetical protein HBI08_010100 [Parastagonospora nodorum]